MSGALAHGSVKVERLLCCTIADIDWLAAVCFAVLCSGDILVLLESEREARRLR